MLSQYIIAISLWCGQPQDVQRYNHHSSVVVNKMTKKSDCQERLLNCVSWVLYKDTNKSIKKDEKISICFKQIKPTESDMSF